MNSEIPLGNVMVDCDDGQKLQKFYGALLGWEMCTLYGKPAVKSMTGIVLLFGEEPGFVRPLWPEEPGRQQKQLHFDFQVEDIYKAAEAAEKLGAVKPAQQFGGDTWITMLDPAGHPFCLCKK